MTTPNMSASQCAEMIAHVATQACTAPQRAQAAATPPVETAVVPAIVPAPPPTDFDALAVAVTSQGSAVSMMGTGIAVLGVVIAVVALIAAVTWSYFIRRWVRETVEAWMDKNAPGEIAKYQRPIAGGHDGQGPEDQARGLGEEPT